MPPQLVEPALLVEKSGSTRARLCSSLTKQATCRSLKVAQTCSFNGSTLATKKGPWSWRQSGLCGMVRGLRWSHRYRPQNDGPPPKNGAASHQIGWRPKLL